MFKFIPDKHPGGKLIDPTPQQKFEKPEKIVRLNNKWTTLYPHEWKEKADCVGALTAAVGDRLSPYAGP